MPPALASAVLVACAGAPRPAPVRAAGGAAAPAASPDPGEAAAGRDLAARLFARDPLVSDDRLLRYVALVGRTVAGAARADAYRFAVTQSDAAYATAFPGGIVAVSRGLIFEMDSEAELAVVLGREICRADGGGVRELPGDAEEADAARETGLDACGARRASLAGYDVAAFLHLLETLQDRAASAREKSTLENRRAEYRKLPETRLGGKLLAERFRRSVIM